MCRNDPFEDEIIPPEERARKALIRRSYERKVQRYYNRARCLNSGEAKNLASTLGRISTTAHEFKRSHSADTHMFKIHSRSQLADHQHVHVEEEIQVLDTKRRLSSAMPSLSLTSEVREAMKETKDPSSVALIPRSSITALHAGIPTQISMPHLVKSMSLAPVQNEYDRRKSYVDGLVPLNPLRMLQRVETSADFRNMRGRLLNRGSIVPQIPKENHVQVPQYLALTMLEKNQIRAHEKQQIVDKIKAVHSEYEARCYEQVREWIEQKKYELV